MRVHYERVSVISEHSTAIVAFPISIRTRREGVQGLTERESRRVQRKEILTREISSCLRRRTLSAL